MIWPAVEREFAGRVAVVVGMVALAASLAAVIVLTYHFLLLVFAGLLLGVLLRGLARPLHHRLRLPIKLAVAVVILLIVGSGWTLGSLIRADVATQAGELARQLPALLQELRNEVRQSEFGRNVLDSLPEMDDVVPEDGTAAMRRIGGVFSTTFGALTSAFLILAVGLFLALEPGIYIRGLLRLTPPGRRAQAQLVLEEIRVTLFHWLMARTVGMLVIGVASWLGLTLLGVPLAYAHGLLAAVLTFIPNIGAVLSVIPPVLLALPQGFGAAVAVVVLYAAIQLVETYVLTPTIERIAVQLPPALILGSQVVLGVLGGIAGLALAAPLTAVVLVLVRRLYVEDVLGDDLATDPRHQPVPR